MLCDTVGPPKLVWSRIPQLRSHFGSSEPRSCTVCAACTHSCKDASRPLGKRCVGNDGRYQDTCCDRGHRKGRAGQRYEVQDPEQAVADAASGCFSGDPAVACRNTVFFSRQRRAGLRGRQGGQHMRQTHCGRAARCAAAGRDDNGIRHHGNAAGRADDGTRPLGEAAGRGDNTGGRRRQHFRPAGWLQPQPQQVPAAPPLHTTAGAAGIGRVAATAAAVTAVTRAGRVRVEDLAGPTKVAVASRGDPAVMRVGASRPDATGRADDGTPDATGRADDGTRHQCEAAGRDDGGTWHYYGATGHDDEGARRPRRRGKAAAAAAADAATPEAEPEERFGRAGGGGVSLGGGGGAGKHG